MFGAIIGDLIGSTYEANNTSTKDFKLFTSSSCITDDSIMTLAVADIIQRELIYDKDAMIDTFKDWFISYPDRQYGHAFSNWAISSDRKPYYSMGNGAAMRISPVGWYASNRQEVKDWSRRITSVTHNHPDAIKAAEVVAMCIYYARRGKSKEYIKRYISKYYDIDFDYEDLVESYSFDCTCEGSVPQALYCFLISKSFLDCLRTSISIGGDSDTIACIACSIAEAYYKHINLNIVKEMLEYIPEGLPNPMDVISKFSYDLEDDYVTSEVLSDKHYVLYVEEDETGFYGHSKRLIVLKDYVIKRLELAGFNKMRTVRKMVRNINDFNSFKAVIEELNSITDGYNLKFRIYRNPKEAGLR